MPHDQRMRAVRLRFSGEAFHIGPASFGERPPRVHVRPNRLTVMNQIEGQVSTLKSQVSSLTHLGLEPCLLLGGGVGLFPGGDTHFQTILGQRNGTRGKWIERARGVVRLIEVEHRGSIVSEIGI